MPIREIQVIIGADIANFTQKMTTLKTELGHRASELNSMTRLIDVAVKKQISTLGQGVTAFQNYSIKMEALGEKTNVLNTYMGALRQTFAALDNDTDRTGKEFKKVREEIIKTEGALSRLGNETGNLKNKLNETEYALDKAFAGSGIQKSIANNELAMAQLGNYPSRLKAISTEIGNLQEPSGLKKWIPLQQSVLRDRLSTLPDNESNRAERYAIQAELQAY